MCGIFGYVGDKEALDIVLEGIKKLEYRGYDSSGVAGIWHGNVTHCKEVGKIAQLEKKAKNANLRLQSAIAHTRWATHGKPNLENAHPHFDVGGTLAVVHNGIIENHAALRRKLEQQGIQFISETDTEVISHLVAHHYKGDLLKAVVEACPELEGAFAFAIVHKDHPERIVVAAKECPMAIGVGEKECFISSDSNAFLQHTKSCIYLDKGEIALVEPGSFKIYNEKRELITKKPQEILGDITSVEKGNYEHFTLKEIHEQPQTIRNAMLSRINRESGAAIFEELKMKSHEFADIERVMIIGCGTSWHAGFIAKYMIEEMARVPVDLEIASELRYKNPIVLPKTLAIAISQSGETADTIAAMREVREKGAKVIAICNVQGSTLAREADDVVLLRAGPEIGVCSTKAFTSQLTVLALFTLLFARMRHLDKARAERFIQALLDLPDQAKEVLKLESKIEKIAKRYAEYENFFFLGRRYMYPASLEGALKLKEISYINASGYPAGEMKHGPIALISPNCPTVAMCADHHIFEKTLSNLMEVKARSGLIIAIADETQKEIESIADECLFVPKTLNELAPILTSIVGQMLAYYIAKERGAEIDQPKNLAKSVTVE